jgi:two-component system sensor histidine kinase/response regulator
MIGELQDAHPGTAIELTVSGNAQGSWDSDRLAQVISNLVGNACQHRSQGTAVGVQLDGTAVDAVILRVMNEGEIPPDVLPVLFDPFRSGAKREDRVQGLGLGLFITQQLVRAHGGSIEVSSGGGRTTMTVRLPRR